MADTTLNICKNIKTPERELQGLSRAEILKCTKASLVAFLLSATGAVSAQQEGNTQTLAMLTTPVIYTDTRPQSTATLTTTPASPAVSAIAPSAKSPELGQWNEIFEKNYNLTAELAKAERKGWSEEMKEAFRPWKIERAKQIDTTVIAKKMEDEQLSTGINTTKETVIALDKGINANNNAIAELEAKIQETNFLTSLISLQSNDTSLLNQIRNALSSTFSALRNHPLLRDMFTAILTDSNCPPLRSEHIVAIQQWLEQNKPS